MIELRLKNGEDVMLYPVLKGNNSFILLDEKNNERLEVELYDNHVVIKDWKEFDSDNSEAMLEQLFTELISIKRSGTEENENQLVKEDNPFNPEQIKVNAKQFSIKLITDMIETKDIDISPDFQRHFVWNSSQKSRLIESLLLRIPLPNFYFAEDEEGRLTVVDGLQRLTTIRDFVNNKFPLRDLEYLDEGVKGRYYHDEGTKKGIDKKYFRWFNMTQLSVNVIDPSSPANVKYDIFKRINTGGRTLNNQEIRNCLSSQKVRTLLKNMVSLEEFKSATSGSLKPTRMADQEMALRFIMFYDAYQKDNTLYSSYDGYMESSLDATIESYKSVSEEQSEKIISRFSCAMRNAEWLFGNKYAFRKINPDDLKENSPKQLLNKALFEVWSVLLADILPDDIRNNYQEGFLSTKFSSLLESDKDLMFYLSYGTNGKANMVYVFKAIKELIKNELK
jgi:uncharacterized protein with ParB-like and HNH nuclease domain